MATPPSPVHPDIVALAKDAMAMESRGDHAGAEATWSRIVERDSAFLPAQLGLAHARIRRGDAVGAIPLLENVTTRAPAAPAPWLALAVARSMVGRHDDAIAAGERAVASAPQLAAVHLGLGDVLRQAGRLEPAASAYLRGLELAPDDPDALNKAAVIIRTMRKLDDAEAMLRKAIARAPYHPYSRVNLGTLLLERGRTAEGEAMLDAAARIPDLPDDARRELEGAQAMSGERATLAASIEAALSRGDPAPITAVIRTLRRPGMVDLPLMRDLRPLADRLSTHAPVEPRLVAGAPRSAAWPAIEAHFNFPGSRDGDAVARSVELVAHPERATTDDELDIVRYAQAVASVRAEPPDENDPDAYEAWLRLRHAELVRHRPSLAPGHFKIIDNLVRTAPHVPRARPMLVAPSLRAILAAASRIPPGVLRAVYLYFATLECHPFFDGNGRVTRLALNRSLRHAGRFPYVRPHGGDGALLNGIRDGGDIGPLIDFIAEGSRLADALDREWADRESRTA